MYTPVPALNQMSVQSPLYFQYAPPLTPQQQQQIRQRQVMINESKQNSSKDEL
jgi:hypothetical protein